MNAADQESPWYRDGLRFACTQCGACCTGAPGYVWVDEEEIARLAEATGCDVDAFASRYVRRVGDRLSLIEYANGDCVFWSRDAGCSVYGARPTQCRTWPFWPRNLETPAAWRDVQRGCPGAGSPDGRWHSMVEIQEIASRT